MLDGTAGGWLRAEEESRLGAGQGTGAALGREDDGVSTAPVQGPDAVGHLRSLLRPLVRICVAVMGVVAQLAAGASIGAWPVSAGPLDAAAELYTSGRVAAILVSGDNRRAGYDEPTVMRSYLLSRGIPEQAIALDYAGFDTYDTCVRARRIFGIERALLVTQDFHEPRAVAICRSVGLDVDGVGDSRARSDRIGWTVSWARERAAAIKAVIDVVSRRDPTLGRQETSVKDAVAWTREHRR